MNKKSITKKMMLLVIWISVIVTGSFLTQCSEDDEITPITYTPSTGTAMINTNDDWSFDKAHSNIRWETAYYGEQALLNGRFNSFGIAIKFDEATPSNSEISSWVMLSTNNTGEPGRDRLGGCLNGYMGIKHNGDTLANGQLDPNGIDSASNYGFFKSKKVERYGDAYMATGDFTFRGVTKEEILYFDYVGTQEVTSSSGKRLMASFMGEFDILAQSDYGITSTSIADKVTIKINAEVRKDL